MKLLQYLNYLVLLLFISNLSISFSQEIANEYSYLNRTNFVYFIDFRQENFQIESFSDSTITYNVYVFIPSDSTFCDRRINISQIDDTIKIGFSLIEVTGEKPPTDFNVFAITFTIKRPKQEPHIILNNKKLTSNKYGLPEIMVFRRGKDFKNSVERIIYYSENVIAFEEFYDESNKLIEIRYYNPYSGYLKRIFTINQNVFYNPFRIL